MTTLGVRLREERKKMGLNQEDFSALVGSSRGSQASYEQDKKIPGGAYLAALEGIGVDILYILTGKRTPSSDGITTETQEEKALLENYRAMDEAARLNMQTVSATFAQANLIKNKAKDGTNE
ncbi:helix-turn-helix domain-containing protein [Salmonella enterica]|nr:XRE family transcriptional regulator [Salmonella enterica subsp. enterica serovar Santiago]EIT2339707.1 helix-turn-helix transcriptional regulator [Salmonella enterica]EBH8969667.1 XRE family transcriptional regulator [Salmonella enterica subsp. enterica serovar Santiago]EJA4991633.1 helix-turn-helix transcriptional regulator [Salmonella enterica]EJA5010892.1 helix-turn-helix transcriptional regulator [Salmonella enterica]